MKLFLCLALLTVAHVQVDAHMTSKGDILESARDHFRHSLHHHLGSKLTAEGIEDMSKILLEKAMHEPMHDRNESDWHIEHKQFVRDGIVFYNSTYKTPIFAIETGGAHFTIPSFYHIKVPEGDYVATNAWWNIVDGEGKSSIPLSELYNHHYLVGSATDPNPLTFCEDSFFWGGGAEYRRMDYTIPKGYGIVRIDSKGVCGANLHFIRGEDLKLHWDGLNNPNGSYYAALKNCAECGYAPGRETPVGAPTGPPCGEFADGSFLCCFTGSRCPVNHPQRRSRKQYRMQYTIEWTRSLTDFKNVRLHCFDLGGTGLTAMVKDQNALDLISEWNVAPYLNDNALDQRCNATVCNITSSVVVGEQHGLEQGMCAGEMVWSYTHMHTGAMKATMFINGKKHCENVPTVGTDLNNTPGNEAGFLVRMSECVNEHRFGNKVRLNKGDVVTIEALYDVDPLSTRYAPFAGGKHGGIMALFFSIIHCDPGTWGERYVCREKQCFGVGKGKHLPIWERQWKTIEDCSKECGEDSPKFLSAPVNRYEDENPVPPPANVSSGAEGTGKIYITIRNCNNGPVLAKVEEWGPSSSFRLFGRHEVKTTLAVPKDIEGGQIIYKTEAGIAGLTLVDMTTDACKSKGVTTVFGSMTFGWEAPKCPLKAGTNVTMTGTINVSPVIPMLAAETTTTIVWITPQNETLACATIESTGKPDDIVI